MGKEKMIEHFTKVIWDGSFDTSPWPFLHVQNVFPPDIYAAILENLPALDQMEVLGRGTPNRFLYWLVKYGVAVENISPFWRAFCGQLFGPMRDQLEHKFDVKGKMIGAELVHDLPSYYIGPHTDRNDKLITGLFYLPNDDRNPKCGTELYFCPTPDERGRGHNFSDAFIYAKTIPYVPNSALFFQRTSTSYHGVRPTPVQRWTLAFDIFT